MEYRMLDEVCGMDESTKATIEESDRLVLSAVKDGKEKVLVTFVRNDKKITAFKAAAVIAGTDYAVAVTSKKDVSNQK
jgi:hypothetical protein